MQVVIQVTFGESDRSIAACGATEAPIGSEGLLILEYKDKYVFLYFIFN